MPELPEVETVRRVLISKIKGRTIKSITVLHNNVFQGQDIELIKEQIKNQTINDILRRGKWLEFELDDYYLLSHLRMEGKYNFHHKKDPCPYKGSLLWSFPLWSPAAYWLNTPINRGQE